MNPETLPHIPPALLRRMEALGFVPGSGEPVGWLVAELERLKADHTALLLGVGHPMWLPSVADAVDHPDQFNATPDEVLHRVRSVVAERDELAATLANERGEGAPPSEGWEWDGEDWRAPGRAVTRYNRGQGWEPLLIGQDGSVIASPCPFDDGRTARAAMIAADAARSAGGGGS